MNNKKIISLLIEVKGRDWLETKRALLSFFHFMGKPQIIMADKDSSFMSLVINKWLEEENVEIGFTTSKIAIADIETLYKTLNKKFGNINTNNNTENKDTIGEIIMYTCNHKMIHNSTGQTPAAIFLYGGEPTVNALVNKIRKINKLNENRTAFDIDTRYRQIPDARF